MMKASQKGLRHPLRSKGAPLPSLKELDDILDRPEVGKRGVAWDDPTVTRRQMAGGGGVQRSAAIDIGRLRAQLRGHDTGLDAQLTPRAVPKKGFAQKFKDLTSNIYSQESVSSQHGMIHKMRASSSMHALHMGGEQTGSELGGRRRVGGGRAAGGGGLALSRSMPAGQFASGIDGPTVGGDGARVEDLTAADPDATGPAMASHLVYRSSRQPRRKRTWREDPQCDPLSRFYEPPNIDHLKHAEEV